MSYISHLLVLLTLYATILLGSNLMVGVTNLFNLAQAAFMGIGAYLGVWLLQSVGVPFVPTMIFVFIATGLSSYLVTMSSIRLKGDYYVLATIGFQSIVFNFLNNAVSITRGPLGISGIQMPTVIAGNLLASSLIVGIILTLFALFISSIVIRSPFGRLLKGIRENEIAVMSLGRNPILNKGLVSFISTGIIGMAGLFYACYISYIDPSNFTINESIFIITAALIGGTGNLKGPIFGALIIVILPEIIRMLGLPDAQSANLRQIIYGLTLIIIMRFRPHGIAGERGI